MSEYTPNTTPEPIEGNPTNVRSTINRRRTMVAAATAAAAAGLFVGVGGPSGAEGVPCDPVMDNNCVPDPTTSSLPEFTKPTVVDSTTTVPETTVPETTVPETTVPETTVPETTVPETTVPETTVPETTVPPTTHVSTPPGMPPMTIAVPGPTTPHAPNAEITG